MSLAMEFLAFLKARKKLCLLPLVVLASVVGLLMILAQTSALAPFIYTLF